MHCDKRRGAFGDLAGYAVAAPMAPARATWHPICPATGMKTLLFALLVCRAAAPAHADAFSIGSDTPFPGRFFQRPTPKRCRSRARCL